MTRRVEEGSGGRRKRLPPRWEASGHAHPPQTTICPKLIPRKKMGKRGGSTVAQAYRPGPTYIRPLSLRSECIFRLWPKVRWEGGGGRRRVPCLLSAFSPWSNFYPAPRAKLNASPPLSLPLSSRGGMQKKRGDRDRSSSARRCKMHRSPQQKKPLPSPFLCAAMHGERKGGRRRARGGIIRASLLSLSLPPIPAFRSDKVPPRIGDRKGEKTLPMPRSSTPSFLFLPPNLTEHGCKAEEQRERERKGS